MRIDILSLFPAIPAAMLGESMMKRAQERGLIELHSHNLRDWAPGKHKTTDDTPYGGGQGMVMKCEPIFAAVEELKRFRKEDLGCRKCGGPTENEEAPAEIPPDEAASEFPIPSFLLPKSKVVLMSPAGRRFDQRSAAEYARESHLIVLCGHYEGVDQRVIDHLVDAEISIGDYVLTNGAIAAVVFVDAIVRLLPGVLGDVQSAQDDSFSTGLLECPHYTRPVEFHGWRVPEVLLSGNHRAIATWRREQAIEKTKRLRPDLLADP